MLPSRRRALRLGGSSVAAATVGLVAGCSAPSDGGTETPTGERILALGDSYTVGTGVPTAERWVTKLVERRREAGHSVADPRVVAENGWTTGDLDEAIDVDENRRFSSANQNSESSGDAAADDGELADEYDLVTLLVGANNCFQEQEPGEFHPTFTAMLERAVGFAPDPEQVVVISVPDYTLTPVGQRNDPGEHASRLTAYNSIVEAEAAAAGTRFVDVVPPSKQVVDRPELIADDDLHPSGAQYDLWLERIHPVAVDVLEN